jgi:hypothetical protein
LSCDQVSNENAFIKFPATKVVQIFSSWQDIIYIMYHVTSIMGPINIKTFYISYGSSLEPCEMSIKEPPLKLRPQRTKRNPNHQLAKQLDNLTHERIEFDKIVTQERLNLTIFDNIRFPRSMCATGRPTTIHFFKVGLQ